MTARRPVDRPASRSCRECGASFVGEIWQRLCWPCWRQEREERSREDIYARGYDAGFRAAIAECTRGQRLDPQLLDRAIQLAHPDRHPPERATLANDVTAQLLTLRQAR